MPLNTRSLLRSVLPAETASPEETMALGTRLAPLLRPGDIVTLEGELGAGKTHLVKGICSALGIPPDQVTSPTFTIVNEYSGRQTIYHIDGYRIERIEEFHELGLEDYLFGDGVCLVEWPERVEALLPPDAIRLRLAHVAPDRRRIEWIDRTDRELPRRQRGTG